MKWILYLAAAQGMFPQQGDQGGASQWTSFVLPLVAIFALYYFLLHMPQKKRQQERQKMLEAMKKGDEVMTTGGILGTITGITDKVATLEIAPKVRIRVAKAHVTEVVNKTGAEEPGEKKSKTESGS